ncbi:hypothetical protein DERF_001528 [Dermatophagoides farinae]|uniref:Uncharacterized protein n=1 Tax=Dermatophagoides farinae TaxID=6954 RepID=A0A922IB10_DERFA|nr:hypothetical protein DERF_001528 [Dermatophagoides farinae]
MATCRQRKIVRSKIFINGMEKKMSCINHYGNTFGWHEFHDLDEDGDDDDIIFSDLMENLIQKDVFNNSNDRTGNHEQQRKRPQSARQPSSSTITKTTITAKTSMNEILLNQHQPELSSNKSNISNNRTIMARTNTATSLEAVFEEDDEDGPTDEPQNGRLS